MLILALSLVFALSGAGIVSFAAETPEDGALSMATVLQTKEGFRENGTAQVRTKKALAGEYSVTYNVSGVTPATAGSRSSISASTMRAVFCKLIYS